MRIPEGSPHPHCPLRDSGANAPTQQSLWSLLSLHVHLCLLPSSPNPSVSTFSLPVPERTVATCCKHPLSVLYTPQIFAPHPICSTTLVSENGNGFAIVRINSLLVCSPPQNMLHAVPPSPPACSAPAPSLLGSMIWLQSFRSLLTPPLRLSHHHPRFPYPLNPSSSSSPEATLWKLL